MLTDNGKDTLKTNKDKMSKDDIIGPNTFLNVGDIVYQNMDRKDGLVLNKGYDERIK